MAFFIFFVSLTCPGCPLLLINFVTKIPCCASRTWRQARKLGKNQDASSHVGDMKVSSSDPVDNIRYKSEKVCVWAPQDTLKKSIGHEVMTKFLRWMYLYQLVRSPNLLKICVAEWHQISKHWTTEWRATRFQRVLKSHYCCYPCTRWHPGTGITASGQMLSKSCCLHCFSLPVKGEANQGHAVGQRVTTSDHALQRPVAESSQPLASTLTSEKGHSHMPMVFLTWIRTTSP